jgi:hypothetical protein
MFPPLIYAKAGRFAPGESPELRESEKTKVITERTLKQLHNFKSSHRKKV